MVYIELTFNEKFPSERKLNIVECLNIDNLDLAIKKGELFSLLGVNGAGKTTTIKMLTCLTMPTSGDAYIGGYSISKQANRVKQFIGVSPQETAVAPNLTVKENGIAGNAPGRRNTGVFTRFTMDL